MQEKRGVETTALWIHGFLIKLKNPGRNCRAGFALRAKNGAVFAISFLISSLTLGCAAVEFHAWFTILFRNKKHNYGSQSCN
jgi:hypothetical protein